MSQPKLWEDRNICTNIWWNSFVLSEVTLDNWQWQEKETATSHKQIFWLLLLLIPLLFWESGMVCSHRKQCHFFCITRLHIWSMQRRKKDTNLRLTHPTKIQKIWSEHLSFEHVENVNLSEIFVRIVKRLQSVQWGEQSGRQSLSFWMNKHSESHRTLLWSGAGYLWEESSEFIKSDIHASALSSVITTAFN